MPKSRIEALRAARSMNDVIAVVNSIKKSVSNSNWTTLRSTSASITLDYNDKDRRVSGEVPKTNAKIKATPAALKSLQAAYAELSRLQENIHELDSAVSLIENNFKTSTKRVAALKAITALRDDIDDQIEKRLASLEKFGANNCPPALEKMGIFIEKHLRKVLPKESYSEIVREMFVAPGDIADSFNFCIYLCVDDLKNEQGYTYHRYYFLLTGAYKNGHIAFFLNALPTFKAPGKFPPGKAIGTETEAANHIDLLLDMHNFETDFDKKPIGVDTHSVKHSGLASIKGVDDVKVEDDSILIQMKTLMSDALVTKAVEAIMPRLKSILDVSGKGTVLQYKIGKKNSKTTIRFIKVSNLGNKPQAKNFHMNVNKLEELRTMLNLTDHDVDAVKFALQHKTR